MPIQFDKFDQQKVDRLKTHLEAQAQKGNPKYYEIYVDSLKAVQKTDEPKEFDGYEDYMTADTAQIKIVIYNSGTSPRNDQFVFSLKAKNPQEALEMGLDGVSFKMLSKHELEELKANRANYLAESEAIQELEDQITDFEAAIVEKDKTIEILEQAIRHAKANGNKIGGLDLGMLLSEGIDYYIRQNTGAVARIPMLEGFAKAIEEDTRQKQLTSNPQPESEVTFTKKSETNPAPILSESEAHFLELFREIQKSFNEQEICDVIEILDRLSQNKKQLATVLELLENKTNQS
ncbi:MAG: hypothetical protein H0U95_15415 [Bacteroidetes bacterium]|nr:hypothetical protein [Bacteroidota bacterium]